jgi:peroxiredoxin Q/BCP
MNTRSRSAKTCSIALIAAVSLCLTLPARANPNPAQLSPGSAAPDFRLPDAEGTLTTLKQFKGKWVVLYFYPKDFTAGCTREAHNFQRDLAKYERMNAVVIGVSVDTVESHKGFCAEQSLGFRLLSDTAYQASEEYGSIMEFQGKKHASRNTYLIDPAGIIRKIYQGVNPANHSQEVLGDLAMLQSQ